VAEDWRRIAFDTGWFHDLSADIRLSAGSIRLAELRSTDTAASVLLRDARLEIGLARAAFNGGGLAGDLAIVDSPGAAGAAWEAQFRAIDLDFAEAASLFKVPQGLSGTVSAVVDVAAGGADVGALVRDLSGTARLDVRDGGVPLFGIAEVATGSLAALAEQTTGALASTPVDTLSAGFSFSGGVGILERSSIVAPAFAADATGWVGLLDGSLGLSGTIRRGEAGAEGGNGMPFTIDGTISRPVARPLALAN
jgi:AsmA protein